MAGAQRARAGGDGDEVKSWSKMLTCFKQKLTQSDLLFERILLVAHHRAIFEEHGWKPED